MQKDFDQWNKIKKGVHHSGTSKLYHAREIWWCSLGVNVGAEHDGGGGYRRPVLILKGLSRETCLVIPLTTASKPHPLRPSIGEVADREARAVLSQMRVVNTKRLVRKIGYLDQDIFETIRKAAKDLL